MSIVVAEYIWIDGETLRSKIKIFHSEILDFPEWNFDGSSTGQSETKNSDLILKPIYSCKNPFFEKLEKSYIVLCEVINPDGTPHETNNYRKLFNFIQQNLKLDYNDYLFGIEQEYVILDKIPQNLTYDADNICNKLIYNPNQHYCSVGTGNALGRKIAEEHMNMCIDAGIKICGINSEVTSSQWEFQIGPTNAYVVSNQLWVARYILLKVAEKYNAIITFHPKPFENLNGNGAHTNFSTKEMRRPHGIKKIYEAIEKLSKTHKTFG